MNIQSLKRWARSNIGDFRGGDGEVAVKSLEYEALVAVQPDNDYETNYYHAVYAIGKVVEEDKKNRG